MCCKIGHRPIVKSTKIKKRLGKEKLEEVNKDKSKKVP